MKARKVQRHVLRAILIVGEGLAEVAFLNHLKALYIVRGCGLALTIKNAHGKGASHVVDVAIRQSRNAQFDIKAALLDTDTDWNEKTKAIAKKSKVQVVPCHPCLEAMLLALHGSSVEGLSSASCKQVFIEHFGEPAHERAVYVNNFSAEVLEKARLTSPGLQQLLRLFGPG
ncbi:MAG: hypothetical protein H7Z77_03680 [Chitinophagaceae bacterium]|nr:hypothetical protein [Polaromonas sp.]